MTILIEIKKMEQKDLQLFLRAINHYAGTMQFLHETLEKKRYAMEMSIAVETWYEIQKKTLGQTPAVNTNLKLSLHKSYVIMEALREYSRDTDNGYDKSRCNRFSMVIDEQLPTRTQLTLNQ